MDLVRDVMTDIISQNSWAKRTSGVGADIEGTKTKIGSNILLHGGIRCKKPLSYQSDNERK
jgi:hypothetical protein